MLTYSSHRKTECLHGFHHHGSRRHPSNVGIEHDLRCHCSSGSGHSPHAGAPDPLPLRAQFSVTFGAIRRLVWITFDGQGRIKRRRGNLQNTADWLDLTQLPVLFPSHRYCVSTSGEWIKLIISETGGRAPSCVPAVVWRANDESGSKIR